MPGRVASGLGGQMENAHDGEDHDDEQDQEDHEQDLRDAGGTCGVVS